MTTTITNEPDEGIRDFVIKNLDSSKFTIFKKRETLKQEYFDEWKRQSVASTECETVLVSIM